MRKQKFLSIISNPKSQSPNEVIASLEIKCKHIWKYMITRRSERSNKRISLSKSFQKLLPANKKEK